MPTYEYRCPDGHLFDVVQKMSDDPTANCPECGAAAERQISGGGGLLFKGEGFYITDYRSEEYKKRASEDRGEAASPAEAKSEAVTESSPVDGETKPAAEAKPGGEAKPAAEAKPSDPKRASGGSADDSA